MPPFKLEGIKSNPRDKRTPKMLYCKMEYQPKVKVSNWNMHLEYQPIDHNPYNPKCFRLHDSHYDALGTCNVFNPISETHDAFRGGSLRSAVFERYSHKYLVNGYSYNCQKNDVPSYKLCADYTTTMQQSYQPPYLCEIRRLEIPLTGNENKRMAPREECKFIDDNFTCFTKLLQNVKGFRQASLNPTWIDKCSE